MDPFILAVVLLVSPFQSGCGGTADHDLDGLPDACELELAARFAPELVVSPSSCNWDAEAGLLRGGYVFGAAPEGDGVRLAYLPAYLHDCGWSGPKCLLRWRGGCDPHVADSELILVDVAPTTGAWRASRVFLSAHCFGRSDGDCRWHEPSELQWHSDTPRVWVAEGKNANYRSRAACDSGHWRFDTCDRNDRSYRFPIRSAAQNIGSAAVPFPDHHDDPACVMAGELPLLAELGLAAGLPGRECLWAEAPFRGWTGSDAPGSTAYARYLGEVAGMAASPAPAATREGACDGSDADPWVSDFRARVESYDGLYALAAERLGAPTTCEGEITMEFDGARFGVLRFGFAEGASYWVESMPPETSIAVLRSPGGFEDADDIRRALEAHTAGIGLAIDWSSPELGDENGEIVHTFWDPELGSNASASLIFSGELLVGVRVSMAL